MHNKVGAMPKRSSGDQRIATMASPSFSPSFKLVEGESIYTIGSCFARGVEHYLSLKGYRLPTMSLSLPEAELDPRFPAARAVLNKYSPYSMVNEIKYAFSNDEGDGFIIEASDGLYLDLQLHSEQYVSLERAMERRRTINRLNRDAIQSSRVVIVTLGLVEVWFDRLTGLHSNQTPKFSLVKRYPGRFQFETMTVQQATSSTIDIVDLLSKHGPNDQRIILTVSPVPIGRTFNNCDVMVANSYSKAALRCAAEEIVRNFSRVDYFPSYETVVLSERDAAWNDDGIHVTPPMVKHNVDRMISAYTDDEATR